MNVTNDLKANKNKNCISNCVMTWGEVTFAYMNYVLQEEKLEDDSFPVNVPADPSEYRLDAVSGSYTILVP